jgi:hypothetical protein
MMVSKWQKWKIGGSVTLILGLGFTAIRHDPAFAAAHDKAVEMGGNQQGGAVVKQGESDRVLQEFMGQEQRRRPQGEGFERRGGREVENEARGGVAMGSAPNGGARGGSGGSVSNGGNASSGGNTSTGKNGLGAITPNSSTQSVVPQQRTRSKHS